MESPSFRIALATGLDGKFISGLRIFSIPIPTHNLQFCQLTNGRQIFCPNGFGKVEFAFRTGALILKESVCDSRRHLDTYTWSCVHIPCVSGRRKHKKMNSHRPKSRLQHIRLKTCQSAVDLLRNPSTILNPVTFPRPQDGQTAKPIRNIGHDLDHQFGFFRKVEIHSRSCCSSNKSPKYRKYQYATSNAQCKITGEQNRTADKHHYGTHEIGLDIDIRSYLLTVEIWKHITDDSVHASSRYYLQPEPFLSKQNIKEDHRPHDIPAAQWVGTLRPHEHRPEPSAKPTRRKTEKPRPETELFSDLLCVFRIVGCDRTSHRIVKDGLLRILVSAFITIRGNFLAPFGHQSAFFRFINLPCREVYPNQIFLVFILVFVANHRVVLFEFDLLIM